MVTNELALLVVGAVLVLIGLILVFQNVWLLTDNWKIRHRLRQLLEEREVVKVTPHVSGSDAPKHPINDGGLSLEEPTEKWESPIEGEGRVFATTEGKDALLFSDDLYEALAENLETSKNEFQLTPSGALVNYEEDSGSQVVELPESGQEIPWQPAREEGVDQTEKPWSIEGEADKS